MAAADGHMNDTDSIELARRRLALALDALEAAAERRSEADRGAEVLANQVQALGGDRARLASELDEATARSRALEAANREVAQRIDQAIETIRGVLESTD
jgi:chromosome segregation ATPase